MELSGIPQIPVGRAIEYIIDLFSEYSSFINRAYSEIVANGITIIVEGMLFFPP